MGSATTVSRYHQQLHFFMTDNGSNLKADHDFPNPGYLLVSSEYLLLTPKRLVGTKKVKTKKNLCSIYLLISTKITSLMMISPGMLEVKNQLQLLSEKISSRVSSIHVLKVVQIKSLQIWYIFWGYPCNDILSILSAQVKKAWLSWKWTTTPTGTSIFLLMQFIFVEFLKFQRCSWNC